MIGERIRAAREKCGYSLDKVATELGVSFQAVSQWENGQTSPRGKRLNQLSEFLNTTKAWLLFGEVSSRQEMSGVDDSFLNSPEFLILLRGAYLESIKLSIAMGWLANGHKKDISFNSLADIFEGKIKETLNLDLLQDEEKSDSKKEEALKG